MNIWMRLYVNVDMGWKSNERRHFKLQIFDTDKNVTVYLITGTYLNGDVLLENMQGGVKDTDLGTEGYQRWGVADNVPVVSMVASILASVVSEIGVMAYGKLMALNRKDFDACELQSLITIDGFEYGVGYKGVGIDNKGGVDVYDGYGELRVMPLVYFKYIGKIWA